MSAPAKRTRKVVALRAAGAQAAGATGLRDAEPCSNHGRTGGRASSLVAVYARWRAGVYAATDPNRWSKRGARVCVEAAQVSRSRRA